MVSESLEFSGLSAWSSLPPGKAFGGPEIVGGPLVETREVTQGLQHLRPGEEVQCAGAGFKDVFFWDGKIRIPDRGLRTEVYLADQSSPALSGAFGAALAWALALRGTLTVHAAGLIIRGLGVLVLGRSGSGKSTLSAAVAGSGGKIISDDAILISSTGADVPRGTLLRPLRRDAFFRPDNQTLLPPSVERLTFPVRGLRETKLCLSRSRLAHLFASQWSLSCIVALGAGERPQHSRVRPLRNAESLAYAIAANPVLGSADRRGKGRLLAAAVDLVAHTPAFALDVGTALLQDPSKELDLIAKKLEVQMEPAGI